MDFLDSLDLKTLTYEKKTDRMRSWYLFEQFKTLEQHELDAAQVLKNRCVQERLLQQEMKEHRARRGLYDQVSIYRGEPTVKHSQDTCLSSTTDDFCESYCELLDIIADKDSLVNSDHGSNTFVTEDFKTLDDEGTSRAGSEFSVVTKEAIRTTDESANQRTIADNIKIHLQTVKENMVSLERYARLADCDATSDGSLDSLGWPKPPKSLRKQADDNQLFYIWSKLVAFAYHVVQLNHGTCYYDYSSQLLTCVLACDALRRGVNRICDILQCYVSPVKYASDSDDHTIICEKIKKKSYVSNKIRKSSRYKNNSSLHKIEAKRCQCYDDGCVGHPCCCRESHRKCLHVNRMDQKRSRPSRKRGKVTRRRSVPRTLWPVELDSDSSARGRRQHVANPMSQLVRYLDDVLHANTQDFQ